MGSFDRSLSIAFGAVVLSLMALFLAVAAALSFQAQDRRQDLLATALAQSVGESVNRVNTYQMPGLLEELQTRIPGLGYVAVADNEGKILAHSQEKLAGKTLAEVGLPDGDRGDIVWQRVHYWQRALAFRGGLGEEVVGTILVGVSIEDLKKDQLVFLWSLSVLSLCGTLAAMGVVFRLSRRFGGRVQLQLDRIIDKAPVAMAIADLDTGKVLRSNETFQKSFGYNLADIPTLDRWFELAYQGPEYREALRASWAAEIAASLQTGENLVPREVRLTTADGEVRTVLVTTALVGHTTSTTFVDRTEQKKAEEALKDLNQSLEEKVRSRSDELERTYRELVDTEKLAALGQLAAGMAHELNTPLGAIQSANGLNQEFLTGSLPGALEFLLTLTEPELVFFHHLSGRNLSLAAARPSLPQRAHRRNLHARLAALGWDADEDLTEYALELGLDDATLEELAASSRRQKVFRLARDFLTLLRMTQVVSDGVSKAAHVVDALRSYLKGTDEEKLTHFSIADQLETILTLFHHKTKHGVEVVRELDTVVVLGDRQRLNQVWMNLVQNALQAMEFQGTLRLGVRRRDAHIHVEIGDSGPGIPETIRDRIFEPYFTTKKRGEGMGLGLDLCRTILREHHGTITFESRPGSTVFSVVLPAPQEF